jgi:hypothetical protein
MREMRDERRKEDEKKKKKEKKQKPGRYFKLQERRNETYIPT